MKKLLVSKPIHKIKALFGNIEEYKSRYAQLQNFFGEANTYDLFAEPIYIPEKMEISWFVERDGRYIPYNKLNEEQQLMAKAYLKQGMDSIFSMLEKSSLSDKESIKETLEIYSEIPSEEDIYVFIDGEEIEDVVLIQWGCISEAYDADRGLIKKMIPADWYPMKFKAIYEDGTIAANVPIVFIMQDEVVEKTSDANGFIDFGEQKFYTIVKTHPQADIEKKYMQKHICSGKPEYIVKVPKIPMMRFKVVNESKQAFPNAKIIFGVNGREVEQTANQEGRISIGGLEKGTVVKAWQLNEQNEQVHLHEFTFDSEETENLIIIKGTPLDMCWKIIGKKKKIVPGADVKFKYNNQVIETTSNEEGLAFIAGVKPEEKVKAKARKKKRRGKKTYTFKNAQEQHILRIRKPIPLWWLLLLLLPLLLLISWTKEVQFKIINELNPSNVVDANVNFQYTEKEFFNFKDMRFFTEKPVIREKPNEKNGIAYFPGVKVTLYSWLFHNSDLTKVIATAECFGSDTLRPANSELKNKKPYPIELGYQRYDYVFNVIDSKSKEPIPDAKVKLIVKSSGESNTFDAKSGVDGKAVFSRVPVCADFTIIAEAYGYHKKTYQTNGKDVFYKSQDKIPLDPLTKTVTFYVKNKRNKQPVPGATAYLTIDGKTVQTTRTNTNGAASMVGAGSFTNVHIIKTMTIKATKTDYFDTTKTAKVAQFINSSTANRTLYIRPKATSVTFKVSDAVKGNAISGAKVIFTVNGKKKTEYSNVNGSVTLANIYAGDKISIYAEKSPKYKPNDAYKNMDISYFIDGPANRRNITLMPEAPPPPPPPPANVLPCNGGEDGTHANSKDVSRTFNLGQPSGTFKFSYHTNMAPDRIIIYCQGKKIWEYYGSTAFFTRKAKINFSNPIITVRVIGDTIWNYKVHCP